MLGALRTMTPWAHPEPPAVLRALGPVERSLLEYHDNLVGTGNTARIVAFDGPLTADLLREALAILQCRHPFLRVGIARTPAPVFVDRPDAVVPITTGSRTAVDDWVGIAEAELAERFELTRGPLLRVVWLAGSTRGLPDMLIFTTCHVVTDGFSSSRMVAEVFEILSELDAGGVPSRGSRPVPPSTTDLVPESVFGVAGALGLAQLLLRQVALSITDRPASLPWTFADLHERRTRLVPHELPLDVIERLAARAKQNGATLHSAFLAAKLIAAATLIEERSGITTPMTLTAVTSTNLRPRLRGTGLGTEVAARLGGVRGVSRVHSKSDFWPLARQAMTDLRRGIARNEDVLGSVLVPVYSQLAAYMPSLAVASVQLANPGRTPVQERYGRFAVTSVQAGLNVCGFGPSLLSHVTTTWRGVHWNVHYCEPLLARDDALAFATTTMRLLRTMAASH